MVKVRLNKNARAWVRALRSGKYKQNRNALTAVNPQTGEITGHCCLGVACELAKKAGMRLTISSSGLTLYYDNDDVSLPESVKDWLGMKDDEGAGILVSGQKTCLSKLNDEGKSFKQIARIIEQKAKELFV